MISTVIKQIKNSPLQSFIIACVFIISLNIGFIISHRATGKFTYLLIGGMLIIIYAGIALRNMPIALTILIFSSATLGIKINTGTSTPLPFGMILVIFLCAIWLIRMALEDHHIHLRPSPMNLPFLLFLLSTLVSWLVGSAIWKINVPIKTNFFIVQAGQYAIFAFSIASILLTANHPISERYRKLWTGFIISIGLAAVILQISLGDNPLKARGVDGAMLMWPFIFLWAQLLFNNKISFPYKILGWLTLPLWAYWAYARVFIWKGGWMPALFALGLLLAFKYRRYFVILLVLSLVIFYSLFVIGEAGQVLLGNEYQSASTIRPWYWYDVIQMTMHSPIFGLGLVSYSLYWKDPTFIPQSRIISGWDKWNAWGFAPPSHNMWVDIFSQTGLVGFILFLWGMIAALRYIYQLFVSLSPGFDNGYVAAILGGVISLCVSSFIFADWMIPYVYNITITGFSHSVYTFLLIGTLVPISSKKGLLNGNTT